MSGLRDEKGGEESAPGQTAFSPRFLFLFFLAASGLEGEQMKFSDWVEDLSTCAGRVGCRWGWMVNRMNGWMGSFSQTSHLWCWMVLTP